MYAKDQENSEAPAPQALKTPVSLLQELCMRRGIQPKYELMPIEGAVHEPTFVYQVHVREFKASGAGTSKKKAKHAAAKAVLDIIIHGPGHTGEDGKLMGVQDLSQVVTPYDDGIPGNPVGELQDICMKRRLPPPIYHLVSEEGSRHERNFGLQCTIGNYKQIGYGKSKKIAKRQAAHAMLQKHEYLQKNVKLSGRGINFVQMLKDVAFSASFDTTFCDIEEQSATGKCQVLLQLATLPVAVCYGSGSTKEEAQSAAAYNALEYLKIMTKTKAQNQK